MTNEFHLKTETEEDFILNIDLSQSVFIKLWKINEVTILIEYTGFHGKCHRSYEPPQNFAAIQMKCIAANTQLHRSVSPAGSIK